MILSRALGRGRVARGERPGWLAAWGPVAVDAGVTLSLAGLLAVALAGALQAAPLWLLVGALFALVFLPVQAVLIVSAMWAARSRWRETESS